MAYDNTNRGTLGKNDRKTQDTHPDYSGKINVAGVDYWLSAWLKEGPTGKFFSLSVKQKDAQPAQPVKEAIANGDMDDDVPF